ncbi:MAG: alpha/beta hydrolase [Pseudomonadales bacterium]|nr:alpha/beta hydrolase [Pseudomonadales bacterium]
MMPNRRVILAIVRKDVYGLLPLIGLSWVIFFLMPVIANIDIESLAAEMEFWVALQANFYYIGFFLAALLMISVLQQDPAASLHADWLTRPISRANWLLAKLTFMLLVIVLPVVVGRILINLGAGLGIGLSVSYALGVEKLGSLLFVPLIFVIALLTPNLKKFIGLFMAMALVFLMPAWSVTRVLLMAIGISLVGIPDSLMWIQGVGMVVAGVLATAAVYWFLYCRRQRGAALASFWALVVTILLLAFPPTWLYDGESALALHRLLINEENAALDDAVVLENTMACFPAARLNDGISNAEEERHIALAAWNSEALMDRGENPLSFATTIRYREQLREWYSPSLYPGDEHSVRWRLDRARPRAHFSAESVSEAVPLRLSYTAYNRFDPIKSTDTEFWLLGDAYVDQLAADPSTQLHLNYDLALLAPTPYELPVDNQRHTFPELGSCKAELDALNNKIEIECLKRGQRPSLISAQLIGVPSSRVDNYNRAIFTGDWVESLGRSRTELTLNRVSLVEHSSVLITAYNIERMLRKELVFDGVLGDDASICPLPQAESLLAVENASWSDKAAHQNSSVAVGNGVRIQVLDWRGGQIKDAPTLLLIHGLGATAHAWDDFAPRLAERYNVVAMTRRGIGESSKPEQGYDIATLSGDVLAVMDALGLEKPILVGHSLGGEELSYIGAHYPERVQALIYADAAYDRTRPTNRHYAELMASLPDAPPVRPSERVSYAAMQDYSRRIGRDGMVVPEGEILETYDLITGARTFDELYLDAIMMGLQPPRYSEIPVPALGLFAVPSSAQSLMEAWYDQNDPQLRAIVQEVYEREVHTKAEQIARFDNEMPNSRAITLSDANHWVFASHEEESLQAIQAFIAGLPDVSATD